MLGGGGRQEVGNSGSKEGWAVGKDLDQVKSSSVLWGQRRGGKQVMNEMEVWVMEAR